MVAIAYRLRATMRSRRGATAGLSVVIAIVCGIVLSIAAGAHRTTTAPDRYTERYGPAPDGYIVQFDAGPPRSKEIAALPAVESVEAYTFLFAGLTPPGTTDGLDAYVFAGSPTGAGKHVVKGRLPRSDAPDEFVATPNFAKNYGAHIGDRFDLLTYTQEQANAGDFGVRPPSNPPLPAVLVGIVDGPSEFDDPTPLVMFSPALIEPITFGISQSQMTVSLKPGSDLDDLRHQLDTLHQGDALGLQKGFFIGSTLRNAIEAQGRGLWLVSLVAGIAAVAVVGQLVTRHIRVHAADRDRLAAMGFTRGQLFAESLARAAVPILFGSALACAVAVVPSDIFPTGLARRLEPTPGLHFDSFVVIIGALLLLICVLGWTAASIALEQRTPKPVRPSSTIEAIAARTTSAQAATGLRFAFTRKTGERGSNASAVAGVGLIVGGLVASGAFGASLNRLVDSPDRYGSNYDLAVGDNGGDSIDSSLVDRLKADPAVAGLTLYAYGAARVGATTVQLVGMQPDRGNLVPRVSKGRVPRGDDELALGLVTARSLGVDVGDSVTMAGATSTAIMHVSGIAIVSGFGPVEGMGEGGVVTFAGLHRLDDGVQLTSAALDLTDKKPATLARIAGILGMPSSEAPRPYQPVAITNVARIRSTPFVLAGLLGGLAALTLVHLMLTSLRKRRRDCAVLAALGADRGWIRRAVHWQATTFTVVPIAIGIPLGIVVGRLVFAAFADSMGAVNDAATPFMLLAEIAVGLLVLANVAAMPSWPRRSARPADGLQAD